MLCIFFFKQKTAYELRISDWSSDVCSSDLLEQERLAARAIDEVDRVGNDTVGILDLGRERRRFEREAARAELLHPGVERRVARIGVWLLMARDVRIFAPEIERFGLAIGVVLACEPGAIAARSGDVVQILRVEGVVFGQVQDRKSVV